MKLSTRVRYGVRAMVELSKQTDGKPIPLRKLAENQHISTKYLEQMAASLKISGLIESVRGAEGGYRLARPADQITVKDVYQVLDVPGDPVDCLNPPCDRFGACATKEVWADLKDAIASVLESWTLRKLADREMELQKQLDSKSDKK